MESAPAEGRWLNRTVLGVGTASFFSDLSHEIATAVLPLLVAGIGAQAAAPGAPAALLGAIEGIADAASGAAKLWAGWWSDRLKRRKPIAILGYAITAIFTALLGAAGRAWEAVAARALAWTGRGIRTPARNALLASGVPAAHFGKAFGFERAMDTAGAVVGPFLAASLVAVLPPRVLVGWTILPGLLAAAALLFLVREAPLPAGPRRPFLGALAALPRPYRGYLLAVGLFGLGDFSHTLLILRAIEVLTPSLGRRGAAASAMTLYGLHNLAGAVLAIAFGAAGDRFGRRRTLAAAYLLGPLMIVLLILPVSGGVARGGLLLTAVFLVGGALLAAEDALESAAAAEALPPDQRGTGFGALAAVNSAGDLISSLVLGILWRAVGPDAAFAAALVPMIAGVLCMRARGARRPGAPGGRSGPERARGPALE